MNEQLDNIEYEYLWKLLANPADPNHSNIYNLQLLVADFPQSGFLRALLMPNGDKGNLKHSAVYFDPVTLHKLATAADNFPLVTDAQIVPVDEPKAIAAAPTNYFTPAIKVEPFVPPVEEPAADEPVAQEEPVATEPEQTETDVADQPESYSTEAENAVSKADENYAAHEAVNDIDYSVETAEPQQEAAAPLMAELATPQEEEVNTEAAHTIEESPEEEVSSYDDSIRYFHQAGQDIEDEVYDEIVSIEDIGLEQLAILNKENKQHQEEPTAHVSEQIKNDHFVFEPAGTESNDEQTEHTIVATAAQQNITAQDSPVNEVSRYNDEKMPYTFMWWLDKTRKEHANVYQPYISNVPRVAANQPKKKEVADELQQQYYENLVSISSIDEVSQAAPKAPPAPSTSKEDKIIERFIQDVPQIKHPSGIRLDNENKAKKSSEDKDELVTETLARIYTEQMLYHKAILTYKKLMLKFPEKSLYFAGQIEQLENKIN